MELKNVVEVTTSAMSLCEKLSNVQAALRVPKNQYNEHGRYSYRSCEDIMEAVKPLLSENRLTLVVRDEIELVGERHYVKAIATLYDLDSTARVETSAYAREDASRKGMMDAQITGAASSFARKYALNGLFCVDDARDPDSINQQGAKQPQKPNKRPQRADSPQGRGNAQDAVEAARRRAWEAALRFYDGDKDARAAYWESLKQLPNYEQTAAFWNGIADEMSRAW